VFGSRGGDNLTIRANNIDTRANYTCRFVRLAEYEALPDSSGSGDGANASQLMDVPATFLVEDDDGAADLRDLACTTPAWGAVYPGTDVRVLLLSDAVGRSDSFGYNTPTSSGTMVVHTRFWSSQFNYSFFEIWDEVDSNDNRRRSMGARGGDNLTFAAWGLDSNATYSVAFTDLSTGFSMVVPADVSGAPTLLTAISPAWGTNFSAAHATITLFHSRSAGKGSSMSANPAMVPSEATATVLPQVEAGCCTAAVSLSSDSINTGSSLYLFPADASVVFVYRAPDNVDVTYSFFPVHNGVLHSAQGGLLNGTHIPGGPAHGGSVPLSINVYGLNPSAWYTCRFVGRSNQSQVLDALPAQPSAPNQFACFVPAWGALFAADSTDVVLLATTAQPSPVPSQSPEPSSTPILAPTPTPSLLPSLITSQAPSLSQLPSNSSRRMLLGTLNATTSAPTVATTIVNATDDDQSDDVGSWSWADGVAIADGTNHRSGLSYVFYAVVLGFDSSEAYGAAGGDLLMFNTSGLDPSATNTAKHQCAFTSAIDRWELRVNASVGPSPGFASCVTPPWGVWRPAERIEVELRLDYSDSARNASSARTIGNGDSNAGWAAVNRGGAGSAGVNTGVVACVDVSGTATLSSEGGGGGVWPHDFYPAWQRVTLFPDSEARGGAAAGQEVVELLGYGLDANGTSSSALSAATGTTVVTASAYSESGGQWSVAALSGVGGLGGSYACGFRDAQDAQRYLESPKLSLEEGPLYNPAVTSTNVSCVTPAWGKQNPGTTTNLTLVYTPPPNLPISSPLYYSGNIALVASSNDRSSGGSSSSSNNSTYIAATAAIAPNIPKKRQVNATLPFAFVPRFARVVASEKYGAMGGDAVVFTGAGFRGGHWSIGTAAAHVRYQCTFTPVISLYELSVEPSVVPTVVPSTTVLPSMTPSPLPSSAAVRRRTQRRALLVSEAPTAVPNNITTSNVTVAPSAQPSPLPSPRPSTSSPSPVPSTPPPSFLPTEPPTPSPTRYRGVVGACQENATVLMVNATNVNATSLTCQTPIFGAAACATNMALTVTEASEMSSGSNNFNSVDSSTNRSTTGERLLPLSRSPALNLHQGALSRWVDDHVDDDYYNNTSTTQALPAAGTVLDASEGSVFYPVPPTLHGVQNATYGPGATVYGHYGDSAYGGTEVLLACFGLDSAATYAARWSLKPDPTTGRRSSANLTTLCNHHDWGATFTYTSIVCYTPVNWGVQFAAGEAQVELLRVDTASDSDSYEALFVATNDGVSIIGTNADGNSSSSVAYVGGEGARTAVGFVFVAVLGKEEVPAEVVESVPGYVDTAGRAGGGQMIGFAGVGFNPLGSYRCHFYTGAAPYAIENSLYSPEVPAQSTELLLCETPAWGRTFPAATVTVRVQYKTGLSVASTLSSTDDDVSNISLTNTSISEQRRRQLASGVGTITEAGDGEVLFEDENGDYWSFIVGPEKPFDFALEVSLLK